MFQNDHSDDSVENEGNTGGIKKRSDKRLLLQVFWTTDVILQK